MSTQRKDGKRPKTKQRRCRGHNTCQRRSLRSVILNLHLTENETGAQKGKGNYNFTQWQSHELSPTIKFVCCSSVRSLPRFTHQRMEHGDEKAEPEAGLSEHWWWTSVAGNPGDSCSQSHAFEGPSPNSITDVFVLQVTFFFLQQL